VYRPLLIVLACLIVVYCTWLVWKLRSGVKRIMPGLPPQNQLSWKVARKSALVGRVIEGRPITCALPAPDGWSGSATETGDEDPEPSFFTEVANDPVTWAAVADSVVAGGAILESFQKIDPQVLHAIEFSTAQDFHGLADFHTYVQDHFFSSPIESADGWFNRLTGYVAEQKAASFFEQAGHHVVFAPVSNQPVWDMLVDGHPIQIKENLGALKDFAVAHPNIPVYTDTHIAAALHMDSVHGLSVLDKDSIHAAATNTVEGIDGTFDPGFIFPVITMGFSAYREIKLLFNEQTTFNRALVHVGMDMAGVGVGAMAGGKLGALIGSIIPGPGTVIGAILGSIVGGIAGKVTSTGVRRLPFHKAREEYNEAIESARAAINGKLEASKEEVERLGWEYQAKLREFCLRVESDAKQQIEALEQEHQKKLFEMYFRFPKFLRELREQLKEQEREALSTMARPDLLRILLPDELCLQRHAVRCWFARARRVIRKQTRAYNRVKPRDLQTLQLEVQRILREFVFDLASLEKELADVAYHQGSKEKAANDIRQQAIAKAEEYRQTLIRDFGSKVGDLHDKIVQMVQNWNSRISVVRRELRRQAAAVGISI
jgi:uncharacterized protein YcfJ